MEFESINTGYIPGVCNIGKEERAMRTRFGLIALAVSLGLAAIMLAWHLVWYWRLPIFLPATGAAIGLIQAGFHFCVKFGRAGVFNFGTQVGATSSVEDAAARQKDQVKVNQILGLSLLAGAVFTLVVAIL